MQVQQNGILVVDGEHLFHRNFYANELLHTSTGLQSGAFYGFINSLKTLQQKYGFVKTFITWGDLRENLKRRSYYANYKAPRDQNIRPEYFYSQLKDLQKFLAYLNIPQYTAPTYEADDVIAYITHKSTQHVYILTGDKDLIQLVNNNTTVVKPGKKHDSFIGVGDVKKYFPINSPLHIIPYLSLLGDKSDNVPGVLGIGVKGATELVKYLNVDYPDFKAWPLVTNFLNVSDNLLSKLYGGLQDFHLSLDLIDLIKSPLSILKDPDVKLLNISHEYEFSENHALGLFKKYEVNFSLLDNLKYPKQNIIKPQNITSCTKCVNLVKSRSKIVPNNFIEGADILFVIDGPGASEDIEGISPLRGTLGDIFDKLLLDAGINRSTVSVANVNRCRARAGGDYTTTEINNCVPYLLHEIKYYKPKLIIPLGKKALSALTNGEYTSVQSNRGNLINYKDMLIYPIWHPTYIEKSPTERQVLISDLKKIPKILKGESIVEDVDYKVLMTVDELADYLEVMKKSKTITFDYETAGFMPNHTPTGGKILCISLSAKPFEARLFPFYGHLLSELRPELENVKAFSLLGEFFSGYPHIAKIAHNAKFEYIWTRESGIAKNIKNLQDTMLLHYLIDENSNHGLKDVGPRFTDQTRYDDETNVLKHKRAHKKQPYYDNMPDLGDTNYAYIPNDILWHYAMIDADVTHRLYPIFMKDLRAQGLEEFAFKYFLPLIKFFGHLKIRGIKIDTDYLTGLIQKYTQRYNEVERELLQLDVIKKAEKLIYQDTISKNIIKVKAKYAKLKRKSLSEAEYLQKYVYDKFKPKVINLNSTDQLKILFFDVLHLKKHYNKKTKNVSLDASVLAIYESQGIEFVKQLLNFRQLGKFLSTFLIGIQNVLVNGRVHTDLLQHGAVTGRLSSKNPNLQNIPSKSDPEKAKEIRRMFVVDDPDEYIFLAKDYGQIEFRIWAQYSQDERMIADINSGVDIHYLTASRVYGIPIDQVTKKQRFKAKGVVFGIMYGRGAKSIAEEFGITLEEAEKIRRTFFVNYPKAEAWIKNVLKRAKTEKQVRNLYGRIRHLQGTIDSPHENLRAEAERQAVNSPIQGAASDTNNLAAYKCEIALNRAGIDAHVVLLVHDQTIFHVRKKDLAEVNRITDEIMQHPTDLINVKLVTDAEVGYNIGDLVDYNNAA